MTDFFGYAVHGTHQAALLRHLEDVAKYPQFVCTDCGVFVHSRLGIGEYFMIAHELWDRFCSDAYMLCVGCVEDRIGRRLNRHDFIPATLAKVNSLFGSAVPTFPNGRPRSDRLLNRMLRNG